MLIYKVLRQDEYHRFVQDGRTAGAAVDLADGYIHLSTGAQLPGTLSRHFASEDGLMLLALDASRLDALKWEPSRGGQLFPHLYRAMVRADVVWERPLPLGASGHLIGDIP